MLEGLTLARPQPLSGQPLPLPEESDEASDFAALLPEAVEAPNPAPPDPAQGAPLPEILSPDPPTVPRSGDLAAPAEAAREANAETAPPVATLPMAGADQAEVPIGKGKIAVFDPDSQAALPHRGATELWRIVQNLRADEDEAPATPQSSAPQIAHAAPANANPSAPDAFAIDIPALADTDSTDPAAPPPDPIMPRPAADQILTGLRPHLSALVARHLPLSMPEAITIQPKDPCRIEIRLDPEELGRVQITLQTEGDALRLMIAVDRPETLDLLRRHSDLLAQSLQDAGFEGAQLGFTAGQDRGSKDPQTFDAGPSASQVPSPPPAAAPPIGGLNLLM